MEGIGPEHLNMRELFIRLKNDVFTKQIEIILALGSSVESDATSLYITKVLKSAGLKVSQLSYGLSVGTDIENADPLTLGKAIADRKVL